MGLDLTPQFVDDAVDTVEGAAVDVYSAAGDVAHGIVSLGEKTARGLWDVAEDGYEAVIGAAQAALEYLWSLVPEPIRHPFGDSTPLHQAAAGWRAVLKELDGATTSMSAGGRSLNANWDGGASDRFLDFLGLLSTAADQLADDVESLATALEQAAKAMDDLNHVVHAVAAELAATLVISAILTLLTGGGGIAVMATQVGLMVARVTRAVSSARAVMFRVRLAVAAVRSTPIARWVERDGNAIRIASTVGGNGTGTYVATGRNPLEWSPGDWAGIGVTSGLSLGAAPLLRGRGVDPDDIKVVAGTGAVANATSANAQAVVDGRRPGALAVGISAIGGAAGSGASKATVNRIKAGPRSTPAEEAVGGQVEASVQGLIGRGQSFVVPDDEDE